MPEMCRQKNFNKKLGLVKKKNLLFFHTLDLKNDLNIKLSHIQHHYTFLMFLVINACVQH